MSALRLLILLSLTIFCGEFAIMLGLDYVQIRNESIANIVDATTLIVIVFPFLYFFVLKTVVAKNKDLTAAHRQLVAAKEDLEQRIAERTNEITVTNRELKQTIERLNVRRTEMARLSETVNFFQACRNLEEAFGQADSQWQSLFPGLSGTLFLMKASHNLLEKAVAWGQPFDVEPCHLPDECWALRRGKPHMTGGADGMAPCRHLSSAENQRYICLPLSAHGETLGTLCLHIPEARDGGQDQADRGNDRAAYHAAVAESIALAISNLRLRETLRHQAVRDQLTGLYNRRYLLETLEREMARAAIRNQHVTVAMLDIDHFKRFNDTFGHTAGDAVLARLGILLRQWKRGEDIVARYGGEEFSIVLPDMPVGAAIERLESLRQMIETVTIEHHGQLLPPVTISCGIASYPIHAADREALINIADEALYRSKRNGRNRISVAHDAADLFDVAQVAPQGAPARAA
jgi:diguanylate cyclase (GGDEF)-like protein